MIKHRESASTNTHAQTQTTTMMGDDCCMGESEHTGKVNNKPVSITPPTNERRRRYAH